MSDFFQNEEKQFIPPDYSEVKIDNSELPFDTDLTGEDDNNDDEFDDDELDQNIDDIVLGNERKIEEIEEKRSNSMSETGFSTPFVPITKPQVSTPPGWGNFGNNSNKETGFWSTPGNNGGSNTQNNWWDSGTSQNNGWSSITRNNQNVESINRNKRVIFIDFFDGLMETYQSQGQPGFLPRAVYDLKPKFDVWTKIAAFSPDYVFAIAQKEFLNDINGVEGWTRVLDGWCCCLSSFLRKQYGSAQILLSTSIYQPKDSVMSSVIHKFRKEDCIYIGLQSGLANQPDTDLMTAQRCGIDYVDLGQLLSNMY